MNVYKQLYENNYLSGNGIFHFRKDGPCGEKYGTATGFQCPRCNGTDFFLGYDSSEKFLSCANKICQQKNMEKTKATDREKKIKDQIENQSLRDNASRKFRLPTRFWDASLTRIKYDDKIMNALNTWIQKPKNFLFVYGPPGTGKTYLLSAILNYLSSKWLNTYYFNSTSLFKKLTLDIGNDNSTYLSIESLLDHDVILFDDLGASALTEWQKEILQILIDSAYENETPMMVTSNFDFDQLSEKIHPRLMDRLRARENTIVYLNYGSMRYQEL